MTKIQIIEAVVAVVIYFITFVLINQSFEKITIQNRANKTRSKIIKKTMHWMVLFVFIAMIISIFGVNQSEILVFMTSVLTVMGIALFAQWSILSNITSGIIIFFYHSVGLDETVSIIDKDYEVEGRISDIGLFFIVLKTAENEIYTIPNNVFLHKTVKKINTKA